MQRQYIHGNIFIGEVLFDSFSVNYLRVALVVIIVQMALLSLSNVRWHYQGFIDIIIITAQ